MGDDAGALEVYEELLGRPGLTGTDYYAIGAGFYQASNYTMAARAFGMAADANARDRDSLEMWARSLQLDSAYTEVPEVANQWIELDPYSQNGYIILAQASNANGDSETTQSAMGSAQGLEVAVDQLSLRRDPQGGGTVNGVVINKTLDQGASVTLRFTFYRQERQRPWAAVTESVQCGGRPTWPTVFSDPVRLRRAGRRVRIRAQRSARIRDTPHGVDERAVRSEAGPPVFVSGRREWREVGIRHARTGRAFSGTRKGARFSAHAGVAQLVEHQLPKLRVAGSSPVSRSERG